MEIKFNKGFSVTLIIILILNYLFGQTLILSFLDFINPKSNYELSVLDIFITSLSLIFRNLSNLTIGIWLFLMAEKFQQKKWTWFLIGLAFGEYSLVFLVILLIVQGISSKVDFYKSLKPILILLIISLLLNPLSDFIINPFLQRTLNRSDYRFMTEYNSYISFINYGIMILLNVVLASKLFKLIGLLQMKGKILWTISTIFLGLFPIILFNELIMIKKEKE